MTTVVQKRLTLFFGLFLAALAVRLTAAAIVGISHEPESDEIEFFQMVESFARGEGLCKITQQSTDGVMRPTAFRMPIPSILMGLGCIVFGIKASVARYVSIVFGSFAAPLMYRFTRRFATAPVATLAAIGVILHPILILNTIQILSESFFVTALLLALDSTVVAVERRSLGLSLWAGLAWGIAMFVKPHAGPMAFLVMCYFFFRVSWKNAIPLAIGVMILPIPWTIRNVISIGHPVVLATEAGETFLGANNPYVAYDASMRGMWRPPMDIKEYYDRLRPIGDEVERSRMQVAIGVTFLKENPQVIPRLVLNKLVRWLTPITATPGKARLIVLCTYGPLLILLACGAFRGAYRSTVPLHLCILCTIVLTLVTAVYWGGLTRGRLLLEILWIPWAAWMAWSIIYSLIPHDRRGKLTGPDLERVVGA